MVILSLNIPVLSMIYGRFKEGLLHDVGNSHKDETFNELINLYDSLTEDICMTWKVDVELLLFDVIMLFLDNDNFHLRLKFVQC